MRDFLKNIEDDFNFIKIKEQVSIKFEVSKILKEHDKDVVIFENIKESDMGIISGICNTREKIASSIGTTIPHIGSKIIEATENPTPIENIEGTSKNFNNSMDADLTRLPVPTYYQRDGGPYITAGVIIAKDPETGVRNASIHRMLVKDVDKLGVRIVPRNLYTYYKKAEKMNKPLEIAIAIGMNPATLLASCTSIPITSDELEVANTFHDGDMKLIKCDSVDL